jgi:hypothetical protein
MNIWLFQITWRAFLRFTWWRPFSVITLVPIVFLWLLSQLLTIPKPFTLVSLTLFILPDVFWLVSAAVMPPIIFLIIIFWSVFVFIVAFMAFVILPKISVIAPWLFHLYLSSERSRGLSLGL